MPWVRGNRKGLPLQKKNTMELKATIKTQGKLFHGNPTKTVEENLVSSMYEAVLSFERIVKEGTPKGVYGHKGGLVSGIFSEVVKGFPVVKGIVATSPTHPYAEVIEEGRRPGQTMPPKGSLTRWIEIKFSVDSVTAERIEYVVRRKIGKKGFEGAHMFKETFNKNWATFQRIFENGGFKIAKDLNA